MAIYDVVIEANSNDKTSQISYLSTNVII